MVVTMLDCLDMTLELAIGFQNVSQGTWRDFKYYLLHGSWHSALTTSTGKVYTFGDGTFGVLGHGNHESVPYPKEVEALTGFRTVRVACGVWHSAAIVEGTCQTVTNVVSKKLYTWGDGDNNRLGHGDKEARLIPTCVQALVDHNFHQLACGQNMTVALATSGHVYTMGSTDNGQLGNPKSDGKQHCLVKDRLASELVEEISCELPMLWFSRQEVKYTHGGWGQWKTRSWRSQ
uniref:Uncharacterized protein n=1 Tax=Arundo donax TaxID=35708 RepID=A0A0A9HKQ2_ARUDO